MPKSRESKTAQRKLNFAAAPPASSETDEDDDVVVDEEQTRESNRKRSAPPSQAAVNKKHAKATSTAAATPNKGTAAAASAIVTPAVATAQQKKKTKKDEDGSSIDDYVPTYIHKNLDYHRKGVALDSLPPKTVKAFELITKHYIIPKNLEQSRSYGPLSGSTYEQRVISAYRLGKLEAIDEPAKIICTACVEIGHDRDDCPTLV